MTEAAEAKTSDLIKNGAAQIGSGSTSRAENVTAVNGDGDDIRASRYLHEFVSENIVDGDDNKAVTTYYLEPEARKLVFFESKIKRISDVDTIREIFRCRFHIYLTWLATKEESIKYNECLKEGTEYKPNWVPNIKWMNAVEIHKVTQWENPRYKVIAGWKHSAMNEDTWNIDPKLIGFLPWLGNWNRIKLEFDIQFAEEFELPGFPFDCQDVSLHLQVDSSSTKCDLLPFPRPKCFLLFASDFRQSEWFFENIICEFKKTSPRESKRRITYPKCSIHIKASRRWYVHVGQIIITFCMFTLGLCTFVQGLTTDEQIGNRLGYVITLLLADVTTVQLAFDNTKYIGYWTILDYYIYSCFTFLWLIIVWTAVVIAAYDDEEKRNDTDEIFFWIFAGSCAVLHIYFLFMAWRTYRKERAKLEMTSLELLEYFEGTVAYDEQYAIAVTFKEDSVYDKKVNFPEDKFNIYSRGEQANLLNS